MDAGNRIIDFRCAKTPYREIILHRIECAWILCFLILKKKIYNKHQALLEYMTNFIETINDTHAKIGQVPLYDFNSMEMADLSPSSRQYLICSSFLFSL